MSKKSLMSIFNGKGKKKNEKITKPVSRPTKVSEDDDSINPQKYIKTDVPGGRTREMVLSYLKLDDSDYSHILENTASPEDIENVVFTVSVPSGLSADEVEDFCNLMENDNRLFREAVKQLSKEKEIMLDEIMRVDARAQEDRQRNLIGTQLSNSSNKADRLQNELFNAKTRMQAINAENAQLKQKLQSGEPLEAPSLADENARLKAELEKVQREISAESAATNERVAQEIENLRAENQNLNAQLSQNQESLSVAVTPEEFDKLQSKLNATNKALQEAQSAQPDDLVRELAQTKKQLQEALDIQSVATSVPVDNDEINQLQDTIDSLRREVSDKESLSRQVVELRHELDNAKQDNTTTSDDLLKAEVDKLQQKLLVATSENDKLNYKIPDNPAEVMSNPDDYEALVISTMGKKKRKHVKTRLTPEDIKRMQDGERKTALTLGGNKPEEPIQTTVKDVDKSAPTEKTDIKKESSSKGDLFDTLMGQANEDD